MISFRIRCAAFCLSAFALPLAALPLRAEAQTQRLGSDAVAELARRILTVGTTSSPASFVAQVPLVVVQTTAQSVVSTPQPGLQAQLASSSQPQPVPQPQPGSPDGETWSATVVDTDAVAGALTSTPAPLQSVATVQGVPVQGVLVQGVPVQGVPVQGVPVQGGQVQAAQTVPAMASTSAAAGDGLAGDRQSMLHLLASLVADRTKVDVVALESSWLRVDERRLRVVLSAMAQVGTPYRYTGNQPGGFDCSGLTSFSWSQVGVKIPRTSTDQINALAPRSFEQLLPGDLIWRPGHIGIYLGVGDAMVHSPQTGKTVEVRKMGKASRFGSPLVSG